MDSMHLPEDPLITSGDNRPIGIASEISHGLFGPAPVNTLSHSYFVKPKTHKILRIAAMIFHLSFVVGACIYFTLSQIYNALGYMTYWGVLLGLIYFTLINFVYKSPSHTKLWRFTYILGEVAFAVEFLICMFICVFLFSILFANTSTWEYIIYEVVLHGLIIVFLWLEIAFNGMEFPKKHVWFLVIVLGLYGVTNYVYTEYLVGRPLYPIITWTNYITYLVFAGSFLVAMAGYFLGTWQYGAKKHRAYKKPRTVSTPDLTRSV